MTPMRIQPLEMYMITKVVAGSFSAALTSQHEILLWGSGDFGTFISPQKIYMDDIRFTDLSMNCLPESFAVAVDSEGLIYTWGSN
jgi:alpha-tubulin suppressor-like RCC1 family protein